MACRAGHLLYIFMFLSPFCALVFCFSSIMTNFANVWKTACKVCDKRKILFIINPKSGVHSKKNLPAMVDRHIDHDRYEVSIEYTAYAGHASEIARMAAADGYYAVVAVGGDGTINEVARNLVHTETALGVVPCGSGNGFARHVGIPVDVKRAIQFLNGAEPAVVDYGKLNGQPFFCSCGVGFDALVSNDFANGNHRGMASYVQKTLLDWLKYTPEVYELEADSSTKRYKAFLIACGNASQYGNNAYITPFASMRDGLLSVSIMEPFTTIEVPIIVAQLFSNTLDKNSHVTTIMTRNLTIRRKEAGPVHYDGEPAMMDAELKVEIVPDGLKVLAMPGWDGTCEPVPVHKQFLEAVAGTIQVPVKPIKIRK